MQKITEITSSVRMGSKRMLESSCEILNDMNELSDSTGRFKSSMEDVAKHTEMIAEAVSRVHVVTEQNTDVVNNLREMIDEFKV